MLQQLLQFEAVNHCRVIALSPELEGCTDMWGHGPALESLLILMDPIILLLADELVHMGPQFHLPLLNKQGILEVHSGTIADMQSRVGSEY